MLACDCDGGVVWPMATDGDDSHPFVERCDDCQLLPDDVLAADVLAARIDGLVIWHRRHVTGPWHPAVHGPRPAPRSPRRYVIVAAVYAFEVLDDEHDDPQVETYERVTRLLSEPEGSELLFVSGVHDAERRDVESPDIDVDVRSHGRTLTQTPYNENQEPSA
jgi:hypothetical protein